MKKILVVMPSLYNGGAERSLVNMLTEFPEDKYKIDLLLLKKEGMFLNQVPSYINILDTPKDIRRLYGGIKDAGLVLPWKLFGNVISRIFTKNSREMRGFRWKYFYGPCIKNIVGKYDVALAYISGEILYLIDEKVDADKKIVWIHNDYKSAGHPKKYDYKHLKNMKTIVSISDVCVNILKQEFPEFENKICLLENITSSKVIKNRALEFVPEEYRKNRINLLSIGRLHEQKGFDIAIEAAKKLKESGKEFKWFIIGTGELENQLQNKIESYQLQNNFQLVGGKENPYPYIYNCDIFVQPSRYEGKSVVLDEAKIIGVPIVATAYPTVKDQLTDGIEGMIVGLSSEELFLGIEKLMDDSQLRQKYKLNLQKKEYGNQNEILKYMKIIDEDIL